ncbi:flagellar hook-length control protein FliK [Roseinatronobacter thiooxidans]|nr:flagellar hook-length control protein FliK [Roseinatronobacter thiooxidans]
MSEQLAVILADLRYFAAKQGAPQADMPEAHMTFLEFWHSENAIAQTQAGGPSGALARLHDNQARDAPVLQTPEITGASGFAPRPKAVGAASAPVELIRLAPPAQGADAGYLSPDGPVGVSLPIRQSVVGAGIAADGEVLDGAACHSEGGGPPTVHAAAPPMRAGEETDDPALELRVSPAPKSGAQGAGHNPVQRVQGSADTEMPDAKSREVGAKGAVAGPPDLDAGQGYDLYARGQPVYAPVERADVQVPDGLEGGGAVTPLQATARALPEGPWGGVLRLADQPQRAADAPVLTKPKTRAPVFAPVQRAVHSTEAHGSDGLTGPRASTGDAGLAQKKGPGLAPYRTVFSVPLAEATGAAPPLAFGQTGFDARLQHGGTPGQTVVALGGVRAASIAGYGPSEGGGDLSPFDRPGSEHPTFRPASAQNADTLFVKTHGPLGDRLAPFVWAQVAEGMRNATQRSYQIQLAPVELGKVQISLNTTEAGMQVLITAERAETLELMRKFASDFEKSLRDMGYQHLDLSFSHGQNSGQHAQAGGAREAASPPVDSLLAPMPLTQVQHGYGEKGMDIRV